MNKKHIQNFPSPLLSRIFSYVDEKDLCNNVPFVCEKWKLASSHSLHVKNAYFEGESVSAKDICFVLSNSPLLDSVTLVSCHNSVPILRQISRCNRNIEKLILKECSSNGDIIPEDVLINILWSLPQLNTIELFNTKFRSHLLFELLATLPNITSIDLSLNEFITMEDLMRLVHNSHITEFKLSRRCERPKITDEEFVHLIRMMSPRLVLLHLDMGGVGGKVYNEILSCIKLVDLKLNNALNLSKSVLNQIPHQLRKLKHLSIEGPTHGLNKDDFHVSLFINNEFGMKIESLRLEKCDSLRDKECCDVVQSCPNLVTYLEVHKSSVELPLTSFDY
ncbi:uncharacterized protein LOC129000675 [Macrosteles quadrilineatus]|uniref:uncharacterized protein LOC129000675 n=1 Tax=Macrosteles quadrilineatus TaxID=74068 RepID=UPI0023E09070|nr:uncharacterized protein LOC129000675 [Macrosteles quadrilineatus]